MLHDSDPRRPRWGRLFNSPDPTPFRERDLDDDAKRFIVEWARAAPGYLPIEIVVQLPTAEVNPCCTHPVQQAVRYNIEGRVNQAHRELRKLLKRAGELWSSESEPGLQPRRKPIDQRCRRNCCIFACHRRKLADLRLGGQLSCAGNLPLWLVADRSQSPALWPTCRGRGQNPVDMIVFVAAPP